MRPLYFSVLVLFIFFSFTGCQPKVISFQSDKRIITSKDSVNLSWEVKGKPSLSVHEKKIASPSGDSSDILEFILVAEKGNKKSPPRTIQVTKVAEISRDRLAFMVNKLRWDTLVASGTKDSFLYRDFEMVSVSSLSHRPVIASHGRRREVFADSGIVSKAFQGMNYSGYWEILTVMSEEEKKNKSLAPEKLELEVIMQPKKH